MNDDRQVSQALARNLKQLRDTQGLSQKQAAARAGIPRPTWGNLESGEANPTLFVLRNVARALGVSLEELLAPPRHSCQLYRSEELRKKTQGDAAVRKLLPEPLAGLEIDRMELPAKGVMIGSPHTPGTREYLTCEQGQIELAAAGEVFLLNPGDVLVFPGDQKHSYRNPGQHPTVAYSVVILVPNTAKAAS